MTHPFLLLDWLCEQANIHLGRHVTYAWLAMLILTVIAFLVSRRLKELPDGLQNLMEAAVGGLENFIEETMGPKGLAYFPLIGTLAFFILTCNLIALVPGGYPATANLNTNAAMALTVFVATHIVGIKEHGFGYVKHFLGPVPILAPLIFVIEIISHLSRPLSLSLRLFGNMYGHEIVLMIFLFLVPLIIPIPVILLGVLVAFIQTFVFTLLAMIYIAGALEEAH